MMKMNLALKYGCNPHQKNARLIIAKDPSPLEILNGSPSYINILDSLCAWQLVRELDTATSKPAAASFKHVSPAGAAVFGALSENFIQSQYLESREYSPVANAYIRARGGDRMCSYGDAAAVSRTVDADLAAILKTEVCDSIIAPDYEPEALQILKTKKKGSFLIFKMDPDYEPGDLEKRELFGFTLEQDRNNAVISEDLFKNIVSENKNPGLDIADSLVVATLTLKYTQSNSICVGYQGQAIGIGAGQQSRIHCTRIACNKADKWFYQQHPKVRGLDFKENLKRFDKTNLVDQYLLWDELSEKELQGMLRGFKTRPGPLTSEEKADWLKQFQGICLSSDALIPFRDNVDRASRSNIQVIAHTGGALRDDEVTRAANEYGMTMYHTGLRLFTH